MAEYIEREKVVEYLTSRKSEFIDDYGKGWSAGVGTAIGVCEKFPAADVAPVVRCEDCKHQEDCMKQLVFWERDHVLEQNVYQYHKLDFCSYGERRSDNA